MPTPRGKRYTIYDALEAAGWFDANPANTYARDNTTGQSLFKGAHEYPKMLYHPLGEEEIIREGEPEINKITGRWEQRSIVKNILHQLVNNKAEEQAAEAEGWHNHPALAIRARVENYIQETPGLSDKEKSLVRKQIPAIASVDRIRQLEEEIARLYKFHGLESKAREIDLSNMRVATAAKTGESLEPPGSRPGDSIEPAAALATIHTGGDRDLGPVPEHLRQRMAAELAAAASAKPTI